MVWDGIVWDGIIPGRMKEEVIFAIPLWCQSFKQTSFFCSFFDRFCIITKHFFYLLLKFSFF